MIKITAPEGKKLKDVRTGNLHAEVICDEAKQGYFVVADSDEAYTVTSLNGGSTIAERVDSLEEELSAAKILLGVE